MKEIPLTRGYIALVDDEDYDRAMQYNWRATTSIEARRVYIYACRWKPIGKGKRVIEYLQKFILNTPHLIDHVNRDGLDNRKSNLRLATFGQNNQNMIKKQHKKNSSQYKGVGFHKGMHRWRVRLTTNYVECVIGYYDTEVEAAVAYNNKAIEVFGEFAKLNILCGEEKSYGA